jgi:hypothetical protein
MGLRIKLNPWEKMKIPKGTFKTSQNPFLNLAQRATTPGEEAMAQAAAQASLAENPQEQPLVPTENIPQEQPAAPVEDTAARAPAAVTTSTPVKATPPPPTTEENPIDKFLKGAVEALTPSDETKQKVADAFSKAENQHWKALIDRYAGTKLMDAGKDSSSKSDLSMFNALLREKQHQDRLEVYKSKPMNTELHSAVNKDYLPVVQLFNNMQRHLEVDEDGKVDKAMIDNSIGAFLRATSVIGAQSDAEGRRVIGASADTALASLKRIFNSYSGNRVPAEAVRHMAIMLNTIIEDARQLALQRLEYLRGDYLKQGLDQEAVNDRIEWAKSSAIAPKLFDIEEYSAKAAKSSRSSGGKSKSTQKAPTTTPSVNLTPEEEERLKHYEDTRRKNTDQKGKE